MPIRSVRMKDGVTDVTKVIVGFLNSKKAPKKIKLCKQPFDLYKKNMAV